MEKVQGCDEIRKTSGRDASPRGSSALKVGAYEC